MLMETPDLFLEGQWDLLMMVTPDTLSLAWLPRALSDVFRDKFQDWVLMRFRWVRWSISHSHRECLGWTFSCLRGIINLETPCRLIPAYTGRSFHFKAQSSSLRAETKPTRPAKCSKVQHLPGTSQKHSTKFIYQGSPLSRGSWWLTIDSCHLFYWALLLVLVLFFVFLLWTGTLFNVVNS